MEAVKSHFPKRGSWLVVTLILSQSISQIGRWLLLRSLFIEFSASPFPVPANSFTFNNTSHQVSSVPVYHCLVPRPLCFFKPNYCSIPTLASTKSTLGSDNDLSRQSSRRTFWEASKNGVCQLPAEETVSRRMTSWVSHLITHLSLNRKIELWVWKWRGSNESRVQLK